MKNSQQKRGFALIEILLALLIITIGVVSMLWINNFLMRKNGNLLPYYQALNYAQSQIETFRSYETLTTISGKFAYNDIVSSATADSMSTGNTTFSRTWTVTTVASPAYKILNVQVTWVDSTNQTQSIQLSTVVAGIDPVNIGNTL